MDEGKDDNHFNAVSKSGSSRRNSLTSDARTKKINEHVHDDSETHHHA